MTLRGSGERDCNIKKINISQCTIEDASCLMRVNAEIKVGDHAGHILAVQVVVGHVDIPHTPSNKHTGLEQ
jgi:hypothetical protein